MWVTIVTLILDVLVKIGLRKKDDADASRVKAVEKTLEGVGDSLDVEKNVRDVQGEIDGKPTDVSDSDGGLNFDKFNEGD